MTRELTGRKPVPVLPGPASQLLPGPPPEPGVSVEAVAFADASPLTGSTAWMHARVRGLNNRQVQFILEREDASGFVEAGEATAVVRAGEASAGAPMRPGAARYRFRLQVPDGRSFASAVIAKR